MLGGQIIKKQALVQSIRVTLWGALGDVLIKKKSKQAGMCPIVLTLANTKYYNNKLYLPSSSSTMIFDDADIPAMKALITNMPASGEKSKKLYVPVDHSAPREGTLENLLLWARNRKNDVRIANVRVRKGWNFPSCGGENCKKGSTRKLGQFWCESCNKSVEFPVLRYRLEFNIIDDTANVVVVMFDEPATTLVRCSAESIMEDDDEVRVDIEDPDSEDRGDITMHVVDKIKGILMRKITMVQLRVEPGRKIAATQIRKEGYGIYLMRNSRPVFWKLVVQDVDAQLMVSRSII
ncbi:nucleic acid-binding, OB-fold protein [Tanacetum coccineum]